MMRVHRRKKWCLQVLNESSGGENGGWKPRDVAHGLTGRTFTLSHRNISFAADGRTIPTIVLQQYNSTFKDFEVKILLRWEYKSVAFSDFEIKNQAQIFSESDGL
jgi:hypothetical protein